MSRGFHDSFAGAERTESHPYCGEGTSLRAPPILTSMARANGDIFNPLAADSKGLM